MIKEIIPFRGEFISTAAERLNISTRINLYDTISHNNLVIVTNVLLLLTKHIPVQKIQLYSNRSHHRFDFKLNCIAIFMLNKNMTNIHEVPKQNKERGKVEQEKK